MASFLVARNYWELKQNIGVQTLRAKTINIASMNAKNNLIKVFTAIL